MVVHTTALRRQRQIYLYEFEAGPLYKVTVRPFKANSETLSQKDKKRNQPTNQINKLKLYKSMGIIFPLYNYSPQKTFWFTGMVITIREITRKMDGTMT